MENISKREQRQKKEVDSERIQAKVGRKGGGEEIERMMGREIDKESERGMGNGGREGCRSHLLSGN